MKEHSGWLNSKSSNGNVEGLFIFSNGALFKLFGFSPQEAAIEGMCGLRSRKSFVAFQSYCMFVLFGLVFTKGHS